ncbi:branched-chain amino acid transport system II carrier protein [Brevibacterium antiquum]
MRHALINKDVLVVGFAMFAIFFGAGNLIFPPQIGLLAGDKWPIAMVALAIAGVGLPILAIVAVANAGSPERLFRPYARWFHPVFMATLLYTGSVAAIVPRTGATGYEAGVRVLLPDVDQAILKPVAIIGFFLIVLAFSIKKSKVVDRIGKYLTPALLILLLIVVVLALVNPIGTPTGGVDDPFYTAFTTSYQTGDVATGLITGAIFIAALAGRGYSTQKQRTLPLIGAAAIAFIGLMVIYGGLEYLGAQGSASFSADTDATVLLNSVVAELGGPPATAALAVAVLFATLTTAIGMATVIGEFTEELSRGKITYFWTILIITVIFIVQAMGGVSYIITFTTPFLLFFYPAMIITVILGLARKAIPNDGVWKGALIGASLLGLYDAAAFLSEEFAWSLPPNLVNVQQAIPLAAAGFGWIVPGIIGAVVGGLIWRFTGLPNSDDKRLSSNAPAT